MMLSVIIPILNEEKRLKSLLPELCLRQKGAFELIIVDTSCSSDNSELVCEEYRVQYLSCTKAGRAAQMNYGAKHAKGDILMFLHADVLPPKGFYTEILKAISTGKKMGFFAYEFLPTNRWLSINAAFTPKDGLFAGGGDQCQFITKAVFDSLGGFDEYYVIMEDFDLMRRVRKENIPYTIIPKRAIVSSRKYQNNSYLWVNGVNFFVFVLFKIGVKPKSLKKIYSRALSS